LLATQAFMIKDALEPFLVGREPLATELLLDQMLRLNRHGRSGLFVAAISAVDCALWDLRGKVAGQPVYRLLGGPTREALPVYASMLGFSVEPDEAAATAAAHRDHGFAAQKWFFAYGPADGEDGMARNLELAHALREALGPHYQLMFDGHMGWDLPYAIQMARKLAPLHPHWLEEPAFPERVASLRRIREAGVPVATGEHVHTRWQVKELLAGGAVDFVQTDPDWTGGISEQRHICSLCSSFDVPVIAHGHGILPALHIAASQSPAAVPMVEYLFDHLENMQFFHEQVYRPVNGKLALPDLPGLGLVLDESKIESREPFRARA
jgi:L-alanine-DL-glutamate epimerase-like enolase superfamily enzyme